MAARTDIEHAPLMTWDVTDLGFRMGLSPEVPRVLDRHVAPVVCELLGAHALTVGDVRGWAVHPGGPAIVEERLELTVEAETMPPTSPSALVGARAQRRKLRWAAWPAPRRIGDALV